MAAATVAAPPPTPLQEHAQLGTLRGVYLPCIQSILGAILFLRLTHVTSQAGCIFTTILILASCASTLFTWSSLSAIVTNGEIQGESGPYYIISRTLGADIGCSLGLLYYIGCTLSCSMYVLGAAEAVELSVRAYYARWGYGFSGHVFRWDVQLFAIFLMVSTTACVHLGTQKSTSRLSALFCGVVLISVLCMVVGCVLFALGWEEGNLQHYDRSFMENLWPKYEPDPFTGIAPDLFSCLALIYPLVTGILSGMSNSNHLGDPSQSIPKGMFWAIITCTIIYLVVCWLFGMVISNRTMKVDKFVTASVSFPHELIVRSGVVISCLGLVLGYILNAPNLIVAMSSDDVLPFLRCLGQDSGQQRKIRALWLTAILVALPTLGGNLDYVSPYVSIFYLLMYAGINAATCISGYVRPPGFRPGFRYFHWSVSGLGFVWCLGLSFCISAVGTFVSLLFFLLMHAYIKKARRLAKSGIQWGTLGSAVRYNIVSSVLNSLAKSAATTVPTEVNLSMPEEGVQLRDGDLSSFSSDGSVLVGNFDNTEEWVHFQPNSDFHAKNWRPQLLTIVDVDHHGTPTNSHLISLSAQLQQTGRGINVVISIIDRQKATRAASVASVIDDICAEANTPSKEAPGESKDRWQSKEESLKLTTSGIDHLDTVKLIQRTKALLMLQMKREGMDGFAEVSTTDGKLFEAIWSAVIHTGLGPLSPNTILLSLPSFLTFEAGDENRKGFIPHEQDITRAEEYLRTISGILNLGKAVILFKGTSFPTRTTGLAERGILDIWWIVNDGGLLLLLPFLMSKHSVWAGINQNNTYRKTNRLRRQRTAAKLRLFAVATTLDDSEKLHEAIVKELSRLRIDAEVVVVDCLVQTNIVEYMRDCPVKVGLGIDLFAQNQTSLGMNEIVNDTASTTHNMTLGEIFASENYKEQLSRDNTPNRMDSGSLTEDQGIETASMLNKAILTHSKDANLVITNLPFIHKHQTGQTYFQFVNRVCDGIDNVMLVRGSGAEVITAYA